MGSDKKTDRFLLKVINIVCYLILCFWIEWWTVEFGVKLGGKWGYSLDMFLGQMRHSSVWEATISVFWLIFECLVSVWGVFMISAFCMLGLGFLACGWPLDDNYEETPKIRKAAYVLIPSILVIIGAVATTVSIWKSAFWNLNNKEFALTCLVTLAPIATCAWCLFLLWAIVKED